MYGEPGRSLIAAPCQIDRSALTGSGIDGDRKRAAQSLLAILGQALTVKSKFYATCNPLTNEAIGRILEIFARIGVITPIVITNHHNVRRHTQCSGVEVPALRAPPIKRRINSPIWVNR